MAIMDRIRWSFGASPMPQLIANLITRALVIIVSFVVVGLYARDVDLTRKAGDSVDGRWGYAVAVSVLSIIVSLIHVYPKIRSRMLFPVDLFLFFLWLVLFGIFGKMYIPKHCKGDGACDRMKIAVWFDLAGMLLWLVSGIMGAINWRRDRVSGVPPMSHV